MSLFVKTAFALAATLAIASLAHASSFAERATAVETGPFSDAQPDSVSFFEGFNGTTVAASGWTTVNRSTTANNTTGIWRTGTAITDGATPPNPVVTPFEGSRFALVSFNSSNSTSTNATISNWMLSPVISGLNNGDVFSFFTTTVPSSAFPDRLEFRLSTAGTSTNVGTTTTSVGDFSTLLLSINPTLAPGGFPEDWTQFSVTLSGLAAPVNGRVAFRYFVTQGGPNGANSNIIGVDAFNYAPIPEPGTWALMAGGIAGLLAWRRRQQAAR